MTIEEYLLSEDMDMVRIGYTLVKLMDTSSTEKSLILQRNGLYLLGGEWTVSTHNRPEVYHLDVFQRTISPLEW